MGSATRTTFAVFAFRHLYGPDHQTGHHLRSSGSSLRFYFAIPDNAQQAVKISKNSYWRSYFQIFAQHGLASLGTATRRFDAERFKLEIRHSRSLRWNGPMTMSTEREIERGIVEGQKNDNLPLRGREALFRSKSP